MPRKKKQVADPRLARERLVLGAFEASLPELAGPTVEALAGLFAEECELAYKWDESQLQAELAELLQTELNIDIDRAVGAIAARLEAGKFWLLVQRPPEALVQEPEPGAACLAVLPEDGEWHPAVVQRSGPEGVTVQFSEYGYSTDVARGSVCLQEEVPSRARRG